MLITREKKPADMNDKVPTQLVSLSQDEQIKIILQSGLFNSDWYLTTYSNVVDSGIKPELHYLLMGGFQGMDPSVLFSSTYYLENNPDLKKAKINPLLHYVTRGKEEGREIRASLIDQQELSDVEWTAREYVRKFGIPMDFSHPKSFNEKIQIYKLFYRKQNLSEYADKYLVRDYVAGIIGDRYLIPIIGLHSAVEDINFEDLPEQFVAKATHGSGWNLLCLDKQNFPWEDNKALLDKWLHASFYDQFREWSYKNVEPRILIEKLILDKNGSIPRDYKIFCFDGEPKFFQVDSSRFSGHRRNIYDTNWNILPVNFIYPHSEAEEKKPDSALLNEMLDIARKLSRDFPFVRVDLYSVPEIYFGELTFYPEAGLGAFDPPEWDELFGEAFHLMEHLEKPEIDFKEKPAYDQSEIISTKTKRFGFNLSVYPKSRWKYADIAFEEMTALLVRQMAKGIRTFFDVGANYGFYSVLVGKSNPAVEIFSFEPVPEVFQLLQMNLARNKVSANTYQWAVSDTQGRFEFQISENSGESGFIANPDHPVLMNMPVDTVSIDQFLDKISDGPCLIKIDTEGNELKALEGMKGLINKIADVRLIIEFNPTCLIANGIKPGEFLDRIDKLGFDIFVIYDAELKYEKYHPSSAWQSWHGERTYKNLYCVKKNQSLNLCAFSHGATLAGAERSLLELTSNLISKYGAVCTVVLPEKGALQAKLEDLGVATIVCDYHWWAAWEQSQIEPLSQLLPDSYARIAALQPALQDISPDIILSSTIVYPWGAITALNLEIPHIWWVKEFGELDYGLEFYYTFQQTLKTIKESSNYVVVNSDALFNAFYADMDQQKCTVAYNNVTHPPIIANIKPYYYFQDSLKLAIAGNIMSTKGQDDAINAVIRLIEQGYDVELCLLGGTSTPFASKLIELVKTKHAEERIHFLGFIDSIYKVIEQADVCLTCSKKEAFGRVTAEAMLQGKPVIGTNTGGTAELLEDGVDGFLYSPGNVDELIQKILYFIHHPEKVREFGEHAKKEILLKLETKPADKIIYTIGVGLKGQKNPNSILLNDLQHKFSLQAMQKLLDKEQEAQNLSARVALNEEELQELRFQAAKSKKCLSWKIVRLEQKIRDFLTPSGHRRGRILELMSKVADKMRNAKDLSLIHSSDLFDEAWYVMNYPDITRTGTDPATHYLLFGGFEGRDPGPGFNSHFYLSAYEDVRKTGMNPLIHYLKFGKAEGRRCLPNRAAP
jgi:FkbM family methyltransferase